MWYCTWYQVFTEPKCGSIVTSHVKCTYAVFPKRIKTGVSSIAFFFRCCWKTAFALRKSERNVTSLCTLCYTRQAANQKGDRGIITDLFKTADGDTATVWARYYWLVCTSRVTRVFVWFVFHSGGRVSGRENPPCAKHSCTELGSICCCVIGSVCGSRTDC